MSKITIELESKSEVPKVFIDGIPFATAELHLHYETSNENQGCVFGFQYVGVPDSREQIKIQQDKKGRYIEWEGFIK